METNEQFILKDPCFFSFWYLLLLIIIIIISISYLITWLFE